MSALAAFRDATSIFVNFVQNSRERRHALGL